MKFGLFMAPFHSRIGNPTRAYEQDLQVIEYVEQLGFDEVWVGEHHSSGVEPISSPEVFIATAAARTRTIRLGTGVISLPYHHPFHVAQRIVLLDHLTRGRVMFGAGPGALATDAYMLGVNPADQRRRLAESFDAIYALFTSDEPISRKSDWFELKEAHLQVRPYTVPHVELALSALISPSGPKLAGRYGASLLSFGATLAEGFKNLAVHWQVYEQVCRENHHTPDRATWRLVGPVHVAETREQAMRDIEYGLLQYCNYYRDAANLPLAPDAKSAREAAEYMIESGAASIGTPEDIIAGIRRMELVSDGGFGTFLITTHNWANPEATRRSYQLFADEVMPVFQRSSWAGLKQSYDWAVKRKDVLSGAVKEAIVKETEGFFGKDHARTRAIRGDTDIAKT
jgi:limonene 1,2-monooxygenase